MKKTLTASLLLLSVLCSAYTQPGNFSLFMNSKNPAEPELLLLEPRYKPDGSIDHYSFSDFVQVYYAYHDNGQPKSKSIYLYNKKTFEWEKTASIFFEYKEGRLVKETTQTLQGRDFSGIKTYSYDPVTRTDIVRHSPGDGWATEGSSYYDDGGSYIRYFDREGNRVDSTQRVVFLDLGIQAGLIDTILFKQVYQYDNKGRTVSEKTSMQYRDSKNNKTYERNPYTDIRVRYDNNRIEYTYTGYGSLSRDNSPNETNILNLVFTTDNKGRLTSRQLHTPGRNILDTRFTYQAQELDKVEHMHDFVEEVFTPLIRLSNFSEILEDAIRSMGAGIRYDIACKDKCSVLTFYSKEEEEREWKKGGTFTICRNKTDRKIVSLDRVEYIDGEPAERDKAEFRHLKEGRTEKTAYYSSRLDAAMEPIFKIISKEDQKGRTIYREKLRYDSDVRAWMEETKEEFAYNDAGHLTFQALYENTTNSDFYQDGKRPDSIAWRGIHWDAFTLNKENKTTESLRKRWAKNQWENSDLQKISYTGFGKEASTEYYDWNPKLGQWVGMSKDSLLYNDKQEKCGQILFAWLKQARKWEPASKELRIPTGSFNHTLLLPDREMDNDSYEETHYTWKDQQWIPAERKIRVKNYTTTRTIDSRWDETTNEWVDTYKYLSERDSLGWHMEEYKWDMTNNCLAGVENTSSYLLEKDPTGNKLIHRVWDSAQQAWKDTLAISVWSSPETGTETYIYERYDPVGKEWHNDRKVTGSPSFSTNPSNHFAEMSRWDRKTGQWIPQYRLTKGRYSLVKSTALTELYSFRAQDQSWQPEYSLFKSNITDENGRSANSTIYSVIDAAGKTWKQYGAVSYQKNFYKWNGEKETFVSCSRSDFGEVFDRVEKMLESFSIATQYKELFHGKE